MAVSSVFPYATQADGWDKWGTSLSTLSTQLNIAALLPGQGGGKIDDIITDVKAINTAAGKVSETVPELVTSCKAQDGFDHTLAQAPTPEECAQLYAKYTKLNAKMKANPTDDDLPSQVEAAQKSFTDASTQRAEAITKHAEDTSGTKFPEVPTTNITPLSDPTSPTSPGGPSDPSDPGSPGGPGDDEPDDGDDDKEEPTGTQLSGDQGQPQGQQQQPQQAQQQPQAQQQATPQGQPSMMAQTPQQTKPKSNLEKPEPRDLSFLDDPVSDTKVETTTSSDLGSTIHGTTKSDVTGAGQNMLGQNQQPGQANANTAQNGRMGGGGMGMMPHGMGGQQSKSARSGDRPEVLTDDPNLLGTVDDENSFDGGLIVSGDPRFDDVLYPELRAAREARENPHLVSRR